MTTPMSDKKLNRLQRRLKAGEFSFEPPLDAIDLIDEADEAITTLRRERDEARDGIRIAVELLDADCLIEAHEKLISVIGELK